ncbi:hypothetical protein DNTS_034144 [Danionella cerebrum]|uniref:Uncharacterized protein n=1 Tax=Danionella cerebrum TaxID=2873325 RepID=A0A553R6W0_9TELE|nr:hypothetical protein DNTS_034144 [Danionella translucida]
MAAYARKVLAAGISCGVSLLTRSLRPVGTVYKLTLPGHRRWRRLGGTAAVFCAVPFLQKPENMTHEDLVRRALSLVTDSTNTFLSQTTLAVIDSFTGYAKQHMSSFKAMNNLVALHKSYEASISKLSPPEEEVMESRKECKHFESCWMNAIHLSEQAVAAAFDGGADQASVYAQSCLQLSQSQVEHVQQLVQEAERQLKDSKAEESERLQITTSEDEDIPDAYLRED